MLRRLTWFTTIVIGLQMVLGGIIVGKDAGFACPNWPLCGKQGMPPMTGSLMLELVHRFSALLVTVLVVWVAVVIWWKHRDRPRLVRTVTLAVVSLFLQVVVGGLIVLFTLPGVVTTIDVINSMALLALFVHLSNLVSEQERVGIVGAQGYDTALQSMVRPAWRLFGTMMLAVLVGAVFRHTGASQALYGQDSYLLSHDQHTPPSQPLSETLLLIHVVTGILAAYGTARFAMAAQRVHRMTRAAQTTMVLVVLQIVLGVASLVTSLAFVVVTAHWALAGLIVADTAWIVSKALIAAPSSDSSEGSGTVHMRDTGTVR